MLFHYIRKNVPLLWQRKGFAGFQRRERLEAKFRHIAEIELPVFGKRLVSVPYVPIMHITPVFVIGIVKAASRGRTCRPVKGIGVILL